MDRNDEVVLRTVDETMRLLRVSRSTVYGFLRNGRLQLVKLNKSTRITDRSIQQLIAQSIEQSRTSA
jgi:excisionase family DNA binding protein